jgi:23S rRNA pseudouridine1911/1915/1917 synthase
MSQPLHVLFEDNHCLAVAKPAPLLTQAPPGIPSLEDMVKAYLKEKHRKPGNVYLGVPHRLDRPVSGVVLFARNSKAARRLAEQFRERQVVKVYWGLVEGAVEPDAGVWENWLLKLKEEARAERVEAATPGARHARLAYRVLERRGHGTFLELIPETGRMHQIRLQASLRGFPVAGDVLYGSSLSFGPPAELPRERVIALHGRSLTFRHPLTYEAMTLTAPLPEFWGDPPADRAGA